MPCYRLQFSRSFPRAGSDSALTAICRWYVRSGKSTGDRLNADPLIAFPESFPLRRNGAW